MSFSQFINYINLPAAAPETAILDSPLGQMDAIRSLRQDAYDILGKLRYVRETWSDSDVPPAQERWVLRQILQCLTVSRNPTSGDGIDRIAAAGQLLSLLVDLPGAAFEADDADDAGYDLVDFDADLDDAERLVAGAPS